MSICLIASPSIAQFDPAAEALNPHPRDPFTAADYARGEAQVQDFVNRVNAQRVELGRPPLVLVAELCVAARLHAEDALKRHYMSHQNWEGFSPSYRASLVGWAPTGWLYPRFLQDAVDDWKSRDPALGPMSFGPGPVGGPSWSVEKERELQWMSEPNAHHMDVTELKTAIWTSPPESLRVLSLAGQFIKSNGGFDVEGNPWVPTHNGGYAGISEIRANLGWNPNATSIVTKGVEMAIENFRLSAVHAGALFNYDFNNPNYNPNEIASGTHTGRVDGNGDVSSTGGPGIPWHFIGVGFAWQMNPDTLKADTVWVVLLGNSVKANRVPGSVVEYYEFDPWGSRFVFTPGALDGNNVEHINPALAGFTIGPAPAPGLPDESTHNVVGSTWAGFTRAFRGEPHKRFGGVNTLGSSDPTRFNRQQDEYISSEYNYNPQPGWNWNDDLEEWIYTTPVPTPTPSPTPSTPPAQQTPPAVFLLVPPSAPTFMPAPPESDPQMAALEQRLVNARQVRNPRARANALRNIQKQINQHRMSVASPAPLQWQSGQTESDPQMAALEQRLVNAQRIRNPRARANALRNIRQQINQHQQALP